jgi:shikimate dehydrogenase
MDKGPFLRLAVIGDPVEHSKSPELHAGFLRVAGLQGSYEAIRVPAGDGERAIEDLRARGYVGLNVTTPLKEEAFAQAHWHDATALASGAVNTLVLGETIEGYNTDGIGALGALADAGIGDFAATKILVLGGGPTARATIAALAAADALVWIWNRTPDRAASIARDLDANVFAHAMAYDAVFAALPPEAVPADPALNDAIRAAPILVDANYGSRATLARALGRSGIDGSRMLNHSANASFTLWCTALGITTTG